MFDRFAEMMYSTMGIGGAKLRTKVVGNRVVVNQKHIVGADDTRRFFFDVVGIVYNP